MSRSLPSVVLRHARQLAGAAERPEASDRELLRRYVADRDEAAFADLVRRHAALVWNVCRRTLRQDQDAEDAFQATFLVLARRAAAVRWRESVAPWLYAVAQRLARKARAGAARPPNAAPPRPGDADPLEEMTARELLTALDEAVAALPEQYRGAVVLCWLESHTQAEAARRLGLSVRTVQRRLEGGQKLLHAALTRRGLALPALLAAVLVARSAAAAVPAAALAAAASRAPVSAHALRLAELLLLSTAGRFKAALALLLVAGVTFAGFGIAATSTSRPAPASPREAEPTASQDEPPPVRTAEPGQPRKDVHGDPLPPGALARMGTVRFRLPYESFPAMAISPDRATVASIDDSGNIHLWDAATGRETYGEQVRVRDGKQAQSRYYIHGALAFSPDGKTLLAGMNRGTMVRRLCLWDVEKRAAVREFAGVPNGIVTAAASPDFKHVAAVADQNVLLWDAASGELVRSWESAAVAEAAGLAFSADGKTLAFGDKDGTIRLCEIDGKKETKRKAPGPVAALAFDKGGKLLASASKRTVVLWDAAKGEEVRRFDVERVEGPDEITGDVSHLAFSPDGKTLAVSVHFHRIELRDAATGRKRATLYGDCNRQCVFSADGKWLGAAGIERLLLWDAATGAPLYPGHDNQVRGVWFTPDDRTLVSLGRDKLCFWNAADGREKAERVVSYSPVLTDDTRLAADSYALGREIRVQEAASGKTLHVLKHKENFSPRLLSPDGKTLVVSYSGSGTQTLALWDVAAGKELHELGLHKGYAGPLALSPDGKLLASFDPALELAPPPPPPVKPLPNPADGPQPGTCLRVWDVKTGAQRLEIPLQERLRDLVFSPDGRRFFTTDWDEGRVCVRETATGKAAGSWVATYAWDGPGLREAPQWLCALAVSPDGRTLATAGSPRGPKTPAVLQLWDADTGEQLRSIRIDTNSMVDALAFSHDGKRLASGGMRDGVIVVWDVAAVTGRPRPKALDLTDRERDELWERLADADAAKGRDALVRLARCGDGAARLIAARVKDLPAAPGAVTAKRLAELLAALDSDDFETREAATRELAAADAKAGDELRKLLKEGKVSPEARRRIESAAEQIDARRSGAGGPALRWLRAVEVLERVGTPEARKVLEKIAAADGPVAEEAKASLRR